MPRYRHPSKYYADDKDIIDLLGSTGVSKEKVVLFLRSFGFWASMQTSETELHDQIARLRISWPKFLDLCDTVERMDHREKISTLKIKNDLTGAQIEEIFHVIKAEREDSDPEEEITYLRDKLDGAELSMKFSEIDHTRNRVMQHREQEQKIIVRSVQNVGLEIDYTHTSRSGAMLKRLKELIGEKVNAKVEYESISLDQLPGVAERVKFFEKMIKNIRNLKLLDVIHLKLRKERAVSNSDSDVAVVEEIDGETEDEDGESDSELVQSEEDLKKLILSGQGLMLSQVYADMKKKMFYIQRAVWKVRTPMYGSPIALICCEFDDINKAFKYDVTGIWRRAKNDKGDMVGEINTTKARPSKEEENTLKDIIKSNAFKFVNDIQTGGAKTKRKPSVKKIKGNKGSPKTKIKSKSKPSAKGTRK